MNPRLVLTLLAALLAPLLPLTAAGAATPVTVTWPEVTSFNPDAAPYRFRVEHADDARYVAAAGPQATPQDAVELPPSGEVVWDFDQRPTTRISILRCADDGCVEVAASPDLRLHRSVTVGHAPPAWRNTLLVGEAELLPLAVAPLDADLTASWRVTRRGRGVVASGAGPVTVRDGLAQVPVGLGHLPDGSYAIAVEVTAEGPSYGRITGTHEQGLGLETEVRAEARLHERVIHPYRDDHVDHATLEIDGREPLTATVELVDRRGRTVWRIAAGTKREPLRDRTLKITGRGAGDEPVPPGEHTVRLTLTDHWGNEATHEWPLRLTDAAYRTERWSRTFPAARTVINTDVGSCSSLDDAGGALRYLSQTRCENVRQSHVGVVHGVYLPASRDRRYANLRVTVNGGPLGGRSSYLLFYYLNARGDYVKRLQLPARSGAHRAAIVKAPLFLHSDRPRSRPYVVWSTGLSSGSRYRVDSFTVEVVRTHLVG